MSPSPTQPRDTRGRRLHPDRRKAGERRGGDRREPGPHWTGQERMLVLVDAERRTRTERRLTAGRRVAAERRSGVERRGQTVSDHIRNAQQRIAHVAESAHLADELRGDLDRAWFRLRLALDQLEEAGASRADRASR
ncbi:MAG TPA: hypothetical protein VFU41_05230 [Gemmatimonadales bacterium]|nr:hypothetical protein [Gemmatimonadales bacterium]